MVYARGNSPVHAFDNPGRGRWYRHPLSDETWPSVTNVLDVSVSKPALVPWAAKITAAEAWARLPEMVALVRRPDCKKPNGKRCGKCRECLNKAIKGHVKIVKDMAADLGTRIHAIMEADVLGKPRPIDPEAEPFAQQAWRFFHDFGVDVEHDIEATEATIINRRIGYAGTGDVWLRLAHPGWFGDHRKRLGVLDYKTSSTRDVDSVYPEYGMQTAALAKAETLLLPDGTEVEPPAPIEWTAILNLRADSYALMPMPVAGSIDDAFRGFQGALPTALYIHQCYGVKPLPVEPPKRLRAVS
jgi:hypothetical protein